MNVSYMELENLVHRHGIEWTAYLQESFSSLNDFFVWISIIFDPTKAYTLYFPLVFHLNRTTGLQLLWTAALSEWLNHLFKNVLFGERPYWWVLQNSDVWENINMTVPNVVQTPVTCETGPGSPSGHVMVNAAVFYVFVNGILRKTERKWLKVLMWTMYVVCMVLIAISRVYIAAHFPHQCICGLFSGVLLGHLLCKVPVIKMNISNQALLAALMAVAALTIYNLIFYMGIDPSWTVPLAKKWCARPEWVHLSTTLFYMFWRYMGTVIGIVFTIMLSSHLRRRTSAAHLTVIQMIILSLMSLLVVTMSDAVAIKNGHDYLVYLSTFILHLFLPYIVMVALPWFMVKVLRFMNEEVAGKHND